MTESEAKRILGRELADSWLRMPLASRDTLRLLLTEAELRAVAVLEGHPLPDPPPQADLDSVIKLLAPILQVAAQPVEHREVQLPQPDFVRLLQLPVTAAQMPEVVQPARRLPEPDFSYLYSRRVSYRPRRYCRSVSPSSRCLTRLAWSAFWLATIYIVCSSWHW